MALYHTVRSDRQEVLFPLLTDAPHLQLQQRIFPDGSEFSNLVQDTYELYHPSLADERYGLLPDSCLTLLFFSGAAQSGAVLCGPLTAARCLNVPPKATVYAVRLRCGCGDWLTGEPLSQLTDRAVPLSSFLSDAAQWQQQLASCLTFQERNAALFSLLAQRSARSYQPMALLRRCLVLISQQRGQLPVAQLAQAVGCSERYLNRIFRQRLGVSTKTHCEITQLHHSLYTLFTTQSRSLLHIAVACGYFDQAHMNRHYHKFLHCSANALRRCPAQKLCTLLSGGSDHEPLLSWS